MCDHKRADIKIVILHVIAEIVKPRLIPTLHLRRRRHSAVAINRVTDHRRRCEVGIILFLYIHGNPKMARF